MSDIQNYVSELRSKALMLRNKVKNAHSSRGFDPSKCGIYELLGVIWEDLGLEPESINPERLKGDAFGIFRIVTDGWILEESDIGQEVMNFRLELRKLASMLEQNK